MAWFRRRSPDEDSLDPQVLLRKAEAAEPVKPVVTGAFRMTISDVFTIRGRGTVVTGQVESGTVSKGQQIRLTRADGGGREVTVDGVEMFRKVVDSATEGDTVGLLLHRIDRSDVAGGDVLST